MLAPNLDEDRQSLFDSLDAVALQEVQAQDRDLDQVATLCGLTRSTEGAYIVVGPPPHNTYVRAPIHLALPCHKLTVQLADLNHDYVTSKFKKAYKPQNPHIPWLAQEFFTAVGYHSTLEAFAPKSELDDISSKTHPAENQLRTSLSFCLRKLSTTQGCILTLLLALTP